MLDALRIMFIICWQLVDSLLANQECHLLYSSGKQSFKKLTQLNACGCSTAFILSPCNLSCFCLTLVCSRLSFTSWTTNKKHLLYRLLEIVPKHEITKIKLTVIFFMMFWVPWNCWPSKVSMDTSVFKRKTNTSALSWENSSGSPATVAQTPQSNEFQSYEKDVWRIFHWEALDPWDFVL